jgi:hypothetical protein
LPCDHEVIRNNLLQKCREKLRTYTTEDSKWSDPSPDYAQMELRAPGCPGVMQPMSLFIVPLMLEGTWFV